MILDHIEGLELSEEGLSTQDQSALEALARLRVGLTWLYEEVNTLETEARKRAASENVVFALVGSVMEGMPMAVVACTFQWYAVSACNYIQLVGWLATKDTEAAKRYVKRVAPDLELYRNKVAAHFALASPRKEDNLADLWASVLTRVVFMQGNFLVNAELPVIRTEDRELTPAHKLSWAFTLSIPVEKLTRFPVEKLTTQGRAGVRDVSGWRGRRSGHEACPSGACP